MNDAKINSELQKMFNVAITRARFKLFIVGNFDYCQKKAKNNALSELLDKLLKEQQLRTIDAKANLPQLTFSKNTVFSYDGNSKENIVCREDTFFDYFLSDIASFKHRLIIYSPFMTENRLSLLLPAFIDAINAGKKIIIVTKAMSDRAEKDRSQYIKCESELQIIGVSILHKKNMHEKLIIVDDDAVWIGSLNALSFTGSTGEIMHRHADSKLTTEYEKQFSIEHLCEAVDHIEEQRCPICGAEMLIKESDEGGIFWQCVQNDYSRNVDQPFPRDGLLRCTKCGAPYTFFMKNEPRWVCAENKNHYQKVRPSDLKLPKMNALIKPNDVRKKVNEYFQQNHKIQNNNEKKDIGNLKGKQNITNQKQGHVLEIDWSMGRAIIQMDDEGNTIHEYPSISAAVSATKINSKSIRDAAKGVQKHAGGFCWKYKENE